MVSWIASPIVAVGEVVNIRRYGRQTFDRLPPTTDPSIQKFLIFYLPRPDGVSIVRVLHAAQD